MDRKAAESGEQSADIFKPSNTTLVVGWRAAWPRGAETTDRRHVHQPRLETDFQKYLSRPLKLRRRQRGSRCLQSCTSSSPTDAGTQAGFSLSHKLPNGSVRVYDAAVPGGCCLRSDVKRAVCTTRASSLAYQGPSSSSVSLVGKTSATRDMTRVSNVSLVGSTPLWLDQSESYGANGQDGERWHVPSWGPQVVADVEIGLGRIPQCEQATPRTTLRVFLPVQRMVALEARDQGFEGRHVVTAA